MKQLTKMSSFFTLIVLFTLSSCVKNEVTNLSLSKSTMAINLGQSDSLVTTITLTGDINEQPVTYSATDSKVVSVKESGYTGTSKTDTKNSITKTIVITGETTGTTNVTIQVGGKTAICEITVNQTIYTFNQALVSNYGNLLDTGTNYFEMYLLDENLSVNTENNIVGIGRCLHIDFSEALTQNSINEGNFTTASTGEANTFFAGEVVADTLHYGTYIVDIRPDNVKFTLVTGGYYTVTAKGDNYLIEGDLTTETNEIVHFSFEGSISIQDQREVPVDIHPELTKGELIYFGDAYNSNNSNNFIAYLATETLDFKDSTSVGNVLALEFNTPLTVTNYIPTGTYKMITKLEVATDLAPNSLVFGYTTTGGYNWGCWYYGDTTNRLKTGNMVVNKAGETYTITYDLFDRFGSRVSGTFNGPLTYIDATSESSGVKAARVKSSSRVKTLKTISNLRLKANRKTSLRFN